VQINKVDNYCATAEIKINTSLKTDVYIQKRALGTLNWEVISNQSICKDAMLELGQIYEYRGLILNESQWQSSAIQQFTLDLESIYLENNKGQYIAIAYNPQITNLKYITQESITNSLGSVYPIIRQSANTGYFQFTLSGLISGEEVMRNLIVNKTYDSCNQAIQTILNEKYSNLFDNEAELLTNYKNNRTIYERLFRDRVLSFLTRKDFKYFRSATEGNKIVDLSNISFTPETRLGRDIYSFSATVTEVSDVTIQNLQKYGFGGM
jgi:hypothetical protein